MTLPVEQKNLLKAVRRAQIADSLREIALIHVDDREIRLAGVAPLELEDKGIDVFRFHLLRRVVRTDQPQRAGVTVRVGEQVVIVFDVCVREEICRRAGNKTVRGGIIEADIPHVGVCRLHFAQLDDRRGLLQPVEAGGGEAAVRRGALQDLVAHGAHLLVEQVRHLADLFELPDRVRLRGADLHIGVKGKHDDDNKGDGQGNDAEKTDEIALE